MKPKARKRLKAGANPAQAVNRPTALAKKRKLAIQRTLAPISQSLASASLIGGTAMFHSPAGSNLEGAGLVFIGMVFCRSAYRAHLKGDF